MYIVYVCMCVPCALMVDHTALQGDASGALIRTTGERERAKVNEREREIEHAQIAPASLWSSESERGKWEV